MKSMMRPIKLLLLAGLPGFFLICHSGTARAQGVDRVVAPIVSPAGLKEGDTLKPGVIITTGKEGFVVLSYGFPNACLLSVYVGGNTTYRVLKETMPSECAIRGFQRLDGGLSRRIELKGTAVGIKKVVVYGDPLANYSSREVLASVDAKIRDYLLEEEATLALLKNDLSSGLDALSDAAAAITGRQLTGVNRASRMNREAISVQQSLGISKSSPAAAAPPIAPNTSSSAPPNMPMLGIQAFEPGVVKELEMNPLGASAGAVAKVFIERRREGATALMVRFDQMKSAPAGKKYVVWAVSPDLRYIRLGQFNRVDEQGKTEVRAATTLPEFGLLITLEEEYDSPPGGPVIGIGGK